MSGCAALFVLVLLAFGAPASGSKLPAAVPGLQYRMDKVAEGIYCRGSAYNVKAVQE